LHFFEGHANLRAFSNQLLPSMAAIPLKISADDQRLRQRQEDPPPENLPEATFVTDQQIPIFCAGGCGEVMGYIGKGQNIPSLEFALWKLRD
jgi:hypothetical protein